MLTLAVLETENTYTLSCSAPALVRAGASYRLEAPGDMVNAEGTPSA
jgi:hypothetical protein